MKLNPSKGSSQGWGATSSGLCQSCSVETRKNYRITKLETLQCGPSTTSFTVSMEGQSQSTLITQRQKMSCKHSTQQGSMHSGGIRCLGVVSTKFRLSIGPGRRIPLQTFSPATLLAQHHRTQKYMLTSDVQAEDISTLLSKDPDPKH